MNSISDLLINCKQKFCEPVASTARTAVAGGRILHETAFTPFVRNSFLNPGFDAQQTIISTLNKKYRADEIVFLAEREKRESHTDAEFFIETYEDVVDFLVNTRSMMFCVDSFNGINLGSRGLCEYSTSVSFNEGITHIGGSIFTPAYDGGILAVGERNGGVFLGDRFGVYKAPKIRPKTLEDSTIAICSDKNFLDDRYGFFLNRLSKVARNIRSIDSCALGLLLVTMGRIDCLVQPFQKPWDWAAGYPLLEEVGGIMRFYNHHKKGDLIWYAGDHPVLCNYVPNDDSCGFVAGNPSIVEWVCEMLQTYWNRSGEIATLVNALSTGQNAYQPSIIEKIQSLVADNV